MAKSKFSGLQQWEAHGLQCLIREGHDCLNGYVKLPSPLAKKYESYDDVDLINLECHGGLTYGPNEDGWIGFDTAHWGDFWPDEELGKHAPNTLKSRKNLKACGITSMWQERHNTWTIERLKEEVESLACQVKELAEKRC